MAQRDPATVEVFTATTPERPFVEVGLIEAQQESWLSGNDTPAIVAEMRARAAAQGCDAMIINSNNDAVVGTGSYRGGGSTHTLKGFRGACIMYKPGPPAPVDAAAPAAASVPAAAPEPATAEPPAAEPRAEPGGTD